MKYLSSLAAGALALLAAGNVQARTAEQCRAIECSGRHIECRSANPLKKIKCEADKKAWKARCEVDKRACFVTAD